MADETTDDRVGNTRRHRRQNLRILVDYKTADGIHCDYASTIGVGGMFLETENPPPPGTEIKLRFRLPEGEELHEIEGAVVWRQLPSAAGEPMRPTGAGIQFMDSSAVARLGRELEDYEL